MCEDDDGIVVFDGTLDYNQKPVALLLTKGLHENLELYCFSQSCFSFQRNRQKITETFLFRVNKLEKLWKFFTEMLLVSL